MPIPAITHAVYIDESGSGSPTQTLDRFWISAAVAVPLAKKSELDDGVERLIAEHYHTTVKELKGADIMRELSRKSSVDEFAGSLSKLLRDIEAHSWVAGTQTGARPLRQLGLRKQLPKDIVRQLLLERINGYLGLPETQDFCFLLIWDISDVQELSDFR